MKPFGEGETARLVFVVTESMTASFGGRRIHPVLSTWSLVHHMEWAARRLLEPHLEAGEEGAGAGVDVRHLAPAAVGARVEVAARVESASPGRLAAAVEARSAGTLLAEGRVHQAIWPKGALSKRMRGAAEGGSKPRQEPFGRD